MEKFKEDIIEFLKKMPKELLSTAIFIEEDWKSLYFSLALLSVGQGEAATIKYIGLQPLARFTGMKTVRVSSILANMKIKGLIDSVYVEHGVGSLYIIRAADNSLELRPMSHFIPDLFPAEKIVEREQGLYKTMGRYPYIADANKKIEAILKIDTLRYFLK